MPFNVTIANLVWSITSLLFAVKGTENSEGVAVSPPSRSSEGGSFRGRIQLAGCSFAANNSENSDSRPRSPGGRRRRQTPSGSVQPRDERREELAQRRRPFGVLGAAGGMAEIAVELEIARLDPGRGKASMTSGAIFGGNSASVRHRM